MGWRFRRGAAAEKLQSIRAAQLSTVLYLCPYIGQPADSRITPQPDSGAAKINLDETMGAGLRKHKAETVWSDSVSAH